MADFSFVKAGDIKHNLINIKQITFEVTDSCNLNCKYCVYGDLYEGYDHRGTRFMNINDILPLLEYFSELWKSECTEYATPITYVSFYGGEPLLNFSFIQNLVQYLEGHNSDRIFYYSMTTNAVLLDKYAPYLVENKFRLLISMDGDELGHSYRVDKKGKNSFNEVYRNLKRLKENYPEYFKNYVSINSVLHDRNSMSLIQDYIIKEFGIRPKVSELSNVGVKPNALPEFERMFKPKDFYLPEDSVINDVEPLLSYPSIKEMILYIHKCSGNVYNKYSDLLYDDGKRSYIPSGTCIPFAKKMFVTVDGKILPCEKINQKFSIGQVSKEGLILDLEFIASEFNAYLTRLHPQCFRCARRPICTQCMYNISNIMENQVTCLSYMTQNDFRSHIDSCLSLLKRFPNLYELVMTKITLQ